MISSEAQNLQELQEIFNIPGELFYLIGLQRCLGVWNICRYLQAQLKQFYFSIAIAGPQFCSQRHIVDNDRGIQL